MTAPLRTIAPMPMRTLLPTVQPWTMADRHPLADDAREVRVNVDHAVVLHVGVAPDADGLAVVAPHDGERPDAGPLGDLDVADDERGGIDPGPGMDLRRMRRRRA